MLRITQKYQACDVNMAERVGFEPTVPSQVLRISSAVQSTTLPPLRIRFRPSGKPVDGYWAKRGRDIAMKNGERKR